MQKSTHRGTCQICGRLQNLPAGVLSKHGYTVAGFGFFNGVCQGAGALPFEKSMDLIPPIIESLIAHAARLALNAAALRADKSPAMIWVHEYQSYDRRRGSAGYAWRNIPVGELNVDSYPYTWKGADDRKHQTGLYVPPDQQAVALNAKRADFLAGQKKQTIEFVETLQDRPRPGGAIRRAPRVDALSIAELGELNGERHGESNYLAPGNAGLD